MPDPAGQSAFFTPHEEAAALIRGKPAVSQAVFTGLLPELRGRAFTVAGLEAANSLQRVRDEIADYARGQTVEGEARTWDDAKAAIIKVLDDAHFSPKAAERRATLLLRTHAFQAYQAANWRVAQEDDDTTHLQYLATEDSHVRASHLALNGVILPKNDPFWQKHFPPWEWGCRCRVRPMNPDQVDDARAEDAGKAPDEANVIEGPVAQRLRDGQLLRAGQAYDVTPPSESGENPDRAYQWHPDHLRLPVDKILERYDPDVRDAFHEWTRQTQITPQATVLDWLEGKALPTRPDSPAGQEGTAQSLALPPTTAWAGKRIPGMSVEEGTAALAAGRRVDSASGSEIRLGSIASDHLARHPEPGRPRFLGHAEAVVSDPEEIWEDDGRRYYLGRTESGPFMVVCARKGANTDEVITFHPKTERGIEKIRHGRLVYHK